MMFLEPTQNLVTVFIFNSACACPCASARVYVDAESTLPKLDISASKDWINKSKLYFGTKINKAFAGPTIDSNIIVPNRITVGGYPTEIRIESLKKYGVTKFICLNTEYGNNDFPAYANNFKQDEFVHFPIKDMSTSVNDNSMIEFCEKLSNMVLAGEHLYIHCAGGHGRTGTVVGIVLKMLYEWLTADDIFNYVQYSHDQRTYHKYGMTMHNKQIWDPVLRNKFAVGQVPTPQTSEQRYQVIRILQII
jgi:hypothetical protein